MRLNDAIIGMIVIIGSLLVIWEARSYPALPGVPYGPGLFPTAVAAAMILGGLLLIFKGLTNRKATGWMTLDSWAKKGRTYCTLGIIFGSLLFYIFFSEKLGFLITSWGILLLLLTWTRGKRHIISTMLITLGFPVVVYFMFATLLRIPLPRGPIVGFF